MQWYTHQCYTQSPSVSLCSTPPSGRLLGRSKPLPYRHSVPYPPKGGISSRFSVYIIKATPCISSHLCVYHRTARCFAPPNIKSRRKTAFYHFVFVVWVLVSQPSTVSRIAGIHTMRMPQMMATKRQESTVFITVTSYLSIIKPARFVSSSFM